MREVFLTPVLEEKPSAHTLPTVKCFTCKKWEVCKIREDYLKTVVLIQKVLGTPQVDKQMDIYEDKYYFIPDFRGNEIENSSDYFLETITTKKSHTGTFMAARYKTKNNVFFLYNIENYYVLFIALWNENERSFEIKTGYEVYYGIPYELSTESATELTVNLGEWREELLKKIEENKDIDIINTSHFSAQLNCEFFEWEKGLTEQEGIKRMIKRYPKGIPCRDGTLYHLATYHIEPHKVPQYHPENGTIAFAPFSYPVFVPPKKKPCQKRKDLNNE